MVFSLFPFCLAALFLSTIVEAQDEVSHIPCGQPVSSHNASITVIDDPAPEPQNLTVGYPGWTVTVDEHQGLTETSIWYTRDGRNYQNDSRGFDACAWHVVDFSRSILVKAAQDLGDCTTAISLSCSTALNDTITASALKWSKYSWAPPTGDHTLFDSSQICEKISNDLSYNATVKWPRECWDDFGYNPTVDGTREGTKSSENFDTRSDSYSLTGNSSLFHNCTTDLPVNRNFPNGYEFSWISGDFSPPPSLDGIDSYSAQVHSMHLVMAVYMEIANPLGKSLGEPFANFQLSCLVPTVNDDSRAVQPLTDPSPAPNNTTQSASPNPATSDLKSKTGLIVGLVVGFLCVIVLISVAFVFNRRKWKKKLEHTHAQKGEELNKDKDIAIHEAPEDPTMNHVADMKKRRDGDSIAEMQHSPATFEAGSGNVHEMNPGDGWLVELPGDSPRGFQSKAVQSDDVNAN